LHSACLLLAAFFPPIPQFTGNSPISFFLLSVHFLFLQELSTLVQPRIASTPYPIREHHGRRVRSDLDRRRDPHVIPRIVPQYPPGIASTQHDNKEKLLLITAFEASYRGSPTPISPDMVPIIIDTGASITITPYKTDFISDIRPVQRLEIKGIASGLSVEGYGTVSYSFYADDGSLQTLHISSTASMSHSARHAFYVPDNYASRLGIPTMVLILYQSHPY
jgi:hypothetical protein